jgi:hypothetical protein
MFCHPVTCNDKMVENCFDNLSLIFSFCHLHHPEASQKEKKNRKRDCTMEICIFDFLHILRCFMSQEPSNNIYVVLVIHGFG